VIVETPEPRWQILLAGKVNHIVDCYDCGTWADQREEKMRRVQDVDLVSSENPGKFNLLP